MKATPENVEGEDLKNMPIEELMAHEKGILNLFEHTLKDSPKLTSAELLAHNISQEEYESIFHDHHASFYEKRAFVDMFRRKWREDKGLCSLFDKRQTYKKAKEGKRSPSNEYKNILGNIGSYKTSGDINHIMIPTVHQVSSTLDKSEHDRR